MNFFYKDYENASFIIQDNGYLLPLDTDFVPGNDKFISENASNYVILPENNIPYFPEANILTKININEEGYFDFNKAILDIGAHAGCYSFRSNFKYAYAFEPNKKMFPFLNINLMLHDKYYDSKTFNVLLSDKNEMIEYDGFWTILQDQSIQPAYINRDHIDKILSHTIDEYNLNNIGLIKIDVEGMEEKVLRGSIGTIVRNNYPPILFECWNVNEYGMTIEKRDSLKSFIENLGYTIYWNWGDYETHLAIHIKDNTN